MKNYSPEQPFDGGHGACEANLIAWLTDPRTEEYLGRSCKLRIGVLSAIITGRSLPSVAREHGVTLEAACKHARRARALFPALNQKLTLGKG